MTFRHSHSLFHLGKITIPGSSRSAFRSSLPTSTRQSHGFAQAKRTNAFRWGLPIAGVSLVALPFLLPSISADDHEKKKESILARVPTTELMRTYLVYTLCSVPALVDHSTTILSIFTQSSIPGISSLTSSIVRNTFFAQFVGGETVQDCVPLMKKLREDDSIATLLSYSVEVEEHHAPFGGKAVGKLDRGHGAPGEEVNEQVEETVRAIETAGRFEDEMAASTGCRGGTWVAVKITGLSPDPDLLHRASNTLLRLRNAVPTVSSSTSISPLGLPYPCTATSIDTQVLARPDCYSVDGEKALIMMPRTAVGRGGVMEGEEGIREGDLAELRKLWGQLRRIGEVAKKNGVRIVLDAEHTWYQPLIDGYTLMLSQEFNALPKAGEVAEGPLPLVYGTYQAYLQRNPDHLEASLAHAKDNNYALGVKLVRGAYHVQERSRWAEQKRVASGPDPVWPNKAATDKAYNEAAQKVISVISSGSNKPLVGVLFGTHNIQSCDMIIDLLKQNGAVEELPNGKLRTKEGVRGQVCMGQLFGMSDNLTESIASRFENAGLPMVLKYIPYGGLIEVLPYLGRRAVENKSLLVGTSENGGGASAERKRALDEIMRRWGF